MSIKFFKNIKGFTLIELVVVFGIIGLLSAAIIAALDPLSQFQKGTDSRRKSDLSQIQRALETYYQDNGQYPQTSNSPYYCMGHFSGSWTWYCGGSSWTPYMNIVPDDPISSQRYAYIAVNNRQGYRLYARLERGSKDPQACSGVKCPNAPDNACGGVQCNYGIASSDLDL